LLFSILLGFFIAAATSNYLKLQTNISQEDSCLIYIFGLVKIIQPQAEEKIAKAIDEYMIAALDYEYLEYITYTSTEFNALLSVIDDVCTTAGANQPLIQNLQGAKEKLLSYRMEDLLASQKVVTKNHWLILGTLSAIISVMLLSLRTEEIFSSVLIGIIVITICQILLLLRDIDANIFLADKIGYGAEPQSVFRAIGKDDYYPEIALKFIGKKNLSKKYRVGEYINYPASFEKTIKLRGEKI